MQATHEQRVALAALLAAAIGCAAPKERFPPRRPAPACSPVETCGYVGGAPSAGGAQPSGDGSGDAGASQLADVTGAVGVAVTAELDRVEVFDGAARISGPGPKGAIVEASYGPGPGSSFTLEGVVTGDQWLFVHDDTTGGAGFFSTLSLHRIPSPTPLLVPALDRAVIDALAQEDPSSPLVDPARAQILLSLTHSGQPAVGVSVRGGAAGALVLYDQGAGIYSSEAEATGSAGVIGLINASTPIGGGALALRLADADGALFELSIPTLPGAASIGQFAF